MGRQVGEGEMRSLCEYMLGLKMTTKLSLCLLLVFFFLQKKKQSRHRYANSKKKT